MHFYALLFGQGWQICSAWVASYSLVSQVIFGALFAATGVIVESFLWPQDADMSRRIARLIVGAIIGPIAVVGGMFLVSLFYYAPTAVLEQSVQIAASNARTIGKREGQAERTRLSKTVLDLQAQIRTAPCSRDLVQAEGERDDALSQADDAENFADRIEKAADDLSKAESEYDQAVNLQRDEWTTLTTGWITMVNRPGISESDAMTELRQYELRKAQMETAQSKLRDKAVMLRELLLTR